MLQAALPDSLLLDLTGFPDADPVICDVLQQSPVHHGLPAR